jgi:dienelactone hydrolase
MPLYLSPSQNHRYLMDNMQHSLAFDGGLVKPWQNKLRRKLKELVGVPDVERPAIKVRSIWKQEHKLGTIEKISFTSEERSDILAYFCTPKDIKPPYPTMICLQGHSTGMHVSIARKQEDETVAYQVEGDRDFGLGAMRHGFAALCIEQRSFGERKEKKQKAISSHGCHDATMHALMLGRTLVGERVFDVDRGIDYLETRGDIDLKRVGVMGNSGGGTATIYSAALLDRIKFAMPSCAFCTYRDSIMSIYHCGDNYVPGILQYAEAADVMGLFAPKPLVVVAGKTDPIFPIKGVRKAFGDLKKIYEAAGAADKLALAVGSEGHRFYEDIGWNALLKILKK